MSPLSTLPAAGLPRFNDVLRSTAQVLSARLRWAIAHWRERRFEDALCRTLRELDDRTLRDLGLDRSGICPAMFRDCPTRSSVAASVRDAVSDGRHARVPLEESVMSPSLSPNRISVRVAAGLGAVVVALSLAGAQLGLAAHYAGRVEASAPAASANACFAAAQVRSKRMAC